MSRALARPWMRVTSGPLLAFACALAVAGPSACSAVTPDVGSQKGALTLTAVPDSSEVCVAEPINATGHTVYYACDCQAGADPKCVPGKDSNGGRNPSTPWRTYRSLRNKFSSLRAGDTVAFCQGGSFANDNDSWSNSNCTAANPCTIRDYVDPRWTAVVPGRRPILTSAPGARGMTMSSANQHGFRVLNLKLLAAGPGATGWAGAGPGTGPTTDILLCNLEVEGYTQGTEFYRAAERIAIVGSRFVNNTRMGIFGACNGLIIKDNYFDNNGFGYSPINQGHGGIYITAGYGTDARYPGPISNVTITGNRMTNNSISHGVCQGTPLVIHGYADGLLIENNYIDGRGPSGIQNGSYDNGGCFGIMVSPGYTTQCGFHNVTIRRNRILYSGWQSISLSECDTCTVEANEIVVRPGGSGIYMPYDYHRSQDAHFNTAVTLQNNTMYYEPGAAGTGITIRAEGGDYVVTSNAIYYAGSRSRVSDCFNIDSPRKRLKAMDHNLCYSPNGGSVAWMTGYRTRLEWATSTGWDTNSLAIDPVFKNISGPLDFTPCLAGESGCSDTSPLIGSADPAHHSDIAVGGPAWKRTANDRGKRRDAAPDIGAYER